jgi:uncharacterized protein GlcG (DUF336 family)
MIATILAAAATAAAGPPPGSLSYGPSITLAEAKQVMAAAQADAARRKVNATIAIVDRYGELVLAEVNDEAQGAALDLVVLKAKSTVNYRRSTQVFNQQITGGNLLPLMLPGATGMGGGGVLLMKGGRIVGAIGETGGADQEVAEAGAAVLK